MTEVIDEGGIASADRQVTAEQRHYIVGIGASAGGLEALRELIANLELDPRLTYVVAQHLSPSRPSMLTPILQRDSKLAVREITESCVPLANTIYIAPPNKDVEIHQGRLRIVTPTGGVGPKPSVNRFFTSLAEDQGEHAIGIILSGTGGDGANGLLSIRTAGGVTFVQQPETAKYDGMPQAAIRLNAADSILPPKKMAEALSRIVSAGALIGNDENELEETIDDYDKIVITIQELTGFSLTQYKRSTVERRIRRRMVLFQFRALKEYYEYVKDNTEEATSLAKDVLISVTEFFRDAAHFEALGRVIEKMVSSAPAQRALRVWIPGCATGEEAYSVAIIFEECIRKLGCNRNFQVFATDIDTKATYRGRSGRYPIGAFDKVSVDIRSRYFEQIGSECVAKKSLRERIVFSNHNLIQDPPFSRIDLISCRNLLIYFTTPLQKRVMELFHYSLNVNGILFLGKSETAAQYESLFSPVEKQKRIYRKIGERRFYRPISSPLDTLGERLSKSESPKKTNFESVANKYAKVVQQVYGPPGVVISPNDDIVYSEGDLTALVRFKSGVSALNLYDLIDDSLRAELRALVYKSRRENAVAIGGRNVVKTSGASFALRMVVRPLEAADGGGLLLVSFEPVPERALAVQDLSSSDRAKLEDPIIIELEHELVSTREHLQTVVQELETSNEELQSLNEELQSANEELQSANEELQTSNEELQSTNEELLTVNEEVQVKSRELEVLASDMLNIHDSIDFPIVVIDIRLRVTRFSPAIVKLLSSEEINIGDSITSLPWAQPIPDLRQVLKEVIETGRSVCSAVEVKRRVFQMRVSPYRAKDGSILGVVMSFPDATDLHQAKVRAQDSEKKLQMILDNIADGVITIDEHSVVHTFNASAEQIFGYTTNEVIGKNLSMLMPPSEAVRHHEHIKRYVETGVASVLGKQREVHALHKDGHVFPMELSVNEVMDGGARIFTGLVRDVSARRSIERALFLERERALVTLNSIADGVITTTQQGEVDYVNPVAERLIGLTSAETLNRPVHEVLRIRVENGRMLERSVIAEVLEKGITLSLASEVLLCAADGHERGIEIVMSPLRGTEAAISGSGMVVVFRDITERQELLSQMTWQARHDPLTGLINRKEMEQRIEHALVSAKKFQREHALLYIDLDQFKIVNDTCGHQAGDEMLRQIAGHLVVTLRNRDSLARLGGDEFAVLLENCPLNKAQHIAEAIQTHVDDYRFIWDDKIFKVGSSIGVVPITAESIDLKQVLRDADEACYAAKDAGRNRVQLHTPNDKNLMRQRRDMQWVANINQIIESNRFVLCFQRIEPLQKGRATHWEVLLRMLDDEGALVLPGVFLPAAERYGQMQKIDRWVVGGVLTMLSEVKGDLPVVAINISGASLSDEKFLRYVSEAITQSGTLGSKLCFEITETAAIANFARAKEFISAMKRLRCRFALDDFGSGMSSFGYLKSLSVDYIKIDGAFVRSINRDVVDLAMVESINRIGRLMGVEIVAESAESDEILDTLRRIGVSYAQGYGVQRPLQADEFLAEYTRPAAVATSLQYESVVH